MKLYEAKDLVRQHLSKTTFDTSMVDAALAHARREIEKLQNFWWMEATHLVSTLDDTRSYNITTAASGTIGGFSLADWKDFRKLYWRRDGETQWKELTYGGAKLEDADLRYATDDSGPPEHAVLDGTLLHIFPTPDEIYPLKLYTYDWTTNPASNLSTDELLQHFPELLWTGALYWAYMVELKDPQGASTWQTIYQNEVKQIRRHGVKRDWRDTMHLIPRSGAAQGIDRFQPYETNYTD